MRHYSGEAAAEPRGSGSMQAKLNRLCMHEERPEIQQSPKTDKEGEQQVTAALAIRSKGEKAVPLTSSSTNGCMIKKTYVQK